MISIIIKRQVCIEALTEELEVQFGVGQVAISAYNGNAPHVEITPLWSANADDVALIKSIVQAHDFDAGVAKERRKREDRDAARKRRNLADQITALNLSDEAKDVMLELLKRIRDLERTVEGLGKPAGGNKS